MSEDALEQLEIIIGGLEESCQEIEFILKETHNPVTRTDLERCKESLLSTYEIFTHSWEKEKIK